MTAGIDAAVARFIGEPIVPRVQHRILDEYVGEQPVGTAFVLPIGHPAIPFPAHAPTMRVQGASRAPTRSTSRPGRRCWRYTPMTGPPSGSSRWPRCRHLILSRLNVTDAGLARLEGLTKLHTLGLVELPITAGLTHLRWMTDLRVLSLSGPFIDDGALAKLPCLPKLERLTLLSTQKTGDGIATLGRFPALRELFLNGSNSSDVALARLTAVPTLQYLYLGGPEVTDAALAHLAALKDLRALDLDETNVTTVGLARLKAVLPGLKVTPIGAARR
jgi:hypothetical protein